MKHTHMQKAVKRINEARELGWTEVDLSGLEIQEIPKELQELADTLEELYLCYTKASDISPLSNLTNLKWLYLWGAGVSDISPLADLTKLQALDLSSCPLVKSPANIQALKKLRENGCEIYGTKELMK